jgi:hypothetical protein
MNTRHPKSRSDYSAQRTKTADVGTGALAGRVMFREARAKLRPIDDEK